MSDRVSATPRPAVTCTRWRRFGHDRLYVAAPDGHQIGYRDLATGTDHPAVEADRALLTGLADAWVGSEVPPAVAPEVPERPWVDLSLNVPGQQARVQAVALREAAPLRTALSRLVDAKTDERAWRRGADGEQLVAAELAKVAREQPAWTALHAVPVGRRGADIDHLVIGPGGVFTVNAKHHKGADIWVGGETLMVNGARTQHVRNARHEAERAGRLLSEALGESSPSPASS